MEPDRFKNNHALYIFGMICLLLSITLFFFSLYILPFLIWHLDYNVPPVLFYMISYLQDTYSFSPVGSKFIAWLMFFIPCMVFGVFSYFISNRIDNQIYHIDNTVYEDVAEKKASSLEMQRKMRESAGIGMKILLLMVIIVVLILLLQFFVQLTS
jgi:hypothetical protein